MTFSQQYGVYPHILRVKAFAWNPSIRYLHVRDSLDEHL